MKNLAIELEEKLNASSASSYLPKISGSIALNVKGGENYVLDMRSMKVITATDCEEIISTITFDSPAVLEQVMKKPENAWSYAGKKLINATDRISAIVLLETFFPGALEKSLSPDRFKALFPYLVPNDSATKTEDFFTKTAPERLKENIGVLKTVRAAYEFHIEGAGIWTVDVTGEGEVYPGTSKSKKGHTITTSREVFEEVLKDDAKAWPLFNSGKASVSNACRASQIVRALWPTAFPKAMPASLYQSLFSETLQDAATPEYNRTQGEFTTYVGGKNKQMVPIKYSKMGDLAIYEGDIILGTVRQMEEACRSVEEGSGAMPEGFRIIDWADPTKYLWPGGVVYYEVKDGHDPSKQFADAMKHWTDNTSITFKKRTTETNYVYVEDGPGCAANVGMIGGKQSMILSKNCSTGNVIHEIGHTVGLFHEQTRQDRDLYVEICWDQIEKGKEFNFKIPSNTISSDVGGYDYSSIMHYGKDAFAIGKDPTIIPKEDVQIGQRSHLSEDDISTINDMYGPKQNELEQRELVAIEEA